MKFAITLFFILALTATTFLFGWVELVLPPGTYGVVFTKSGGWDEKVIPSGGITWRWERLIPTNMTLYRFDQTSHEVRHRFTNSLPSADVYATELGLDIDEFSYDLGILILLRLRADHLPGLAATQDIRPDTLHAWYDQVPSDAGSVAQSALLSSKATELMMDFRSLEEIVRQQIERQHPNLEVLKVALTPYAIPDYDLYLFAKKAVTERLASQQQARSIVAGDLAFIREQVRQHTASLRELGRTVAEFPDLVALLSSPASDLIARVLGMTHASILPTPETLPKKP